MPELRRVRVFKWSTEHREIRELGDANFETWGTTWQQVGENATPVQETCAIVSFDDGHVEILHPDCIRFHTRP